MAKFNEEQSALINALGNIGIEDGSITIENENAVKDFVKSRSGLTDEQLSGARTALTDALAPLTDAIGRAALQGLKDDDDLASISRNVETGLFDIDLAFTRPTNPKKGKLTRAQASANFSSRLTVRGLDSTVEVLEELGDHWLSLNS